MAAAGGSLEIVDWFLIATALGFITLRDPQVMGVIRHLDGEVDALLRLPAVPVLHQVVARRHLHDDPVYVDVEGAVDVRLHAAGKGVDLLWRRASDGRSPSRPTCQMGIQRGPASIVFTPA